MKLSNVLFGILFSVGICALFAFTAPPVRHEIIPVSIWKDFAKKTSGNSPKTTLDLPQTMRDSNPPLKPRFDNFIQGSNSNGAGIDLKDPKVVEQSVEYDPDTDQYIISEKIGDDYFRTPTYMTFSEYLDWKAAQQQTAYFDRLAGASSGDRSTSGAVDPLAKFEVKNSLVDRLFGGTEVSIKPQGNIDLTFGVNYQRLDNPTLPIRTQRQTRFDFNMDISMNATGKIGEKLNLAFNYNTRATFDVDNVIKLHYDPKAGFGEDDILQNIEAGNVSLPLRGTLIKGSQRLFGIKTDLKFGRLRLTTVASQQQSKQQNLTVKGGGQVQQYAIPIDEYDENRHFFLTQYNRSTFEKSLMCLPVVQSLFKITKLQVWATNENNQVTTNRRDIVALADLGEPAPYDVKWKGGMAPRDLVGMPLPDNLSNTLYQEVTSDSAYRFSDKAVQRLNGSGLRQIVDYEKYTARLLDPSRDYTFHEDLGFISINLNVQTDHIVAVAFEYTYNGIRHQVGEFVDEVANQNTQDTTAAAPVELHQKVLFTKMLKPRTANVKLPIWDLMMKNIYAVGASQVEPIDFRFDIFYEDGKGEKRFIPKVATEVNPIANVPLLQIMRLDTLNQQRDPGADGVFDFVPGLTINLRSGRVMFPVLEPFGLNLLKKILPDYLTNRTDSLYFAGKYAFQELYDSTVTAARENLEKNRYTIRGSYKSQNSAEISLGAFNIPQGSVRVSGGGIQMVEGRDYEVDYNIGKVRILNDAVLQSGSPVNVSFEDNTLFGFNQRTMLGARADYDFSKNLSVGATWMNLFERPLTQKINIGDDPINNKVYGLDLNYSKDAPWLTKAIDKIPFINTKAPSSVTFQAEGALLDPGHSKAINSKLDKGGLVYLDDFEGSSSGFDLRTPYTAWTLASVPQNDWATKDRWPEASLSDDLRVGANRARMAWYQADPSARNAEDNSNPYTKIISSLEIYPNRQLTPLDNSFLRPFDLTYYPSERGQYNFDVPGGHPGFSAGLSNLRDGTLNNPETRWAGIMRGLTTNDFEQANIEFVEFWMLNPFIDKPDDPGAITKNGKLILHLGTMSEDILKDGSVFYENGLPTPNDPTVVTRQTNVGRVPFYQPIVNFFDNEGANRKLQDVGLDGMNDTLEREQFRPWLDQLKPFLLPSAFESIEMDPSNDDYRYFRSQAWPATAGLLTKYSKFNATEGNSPVATPGNNFVEASTTFPDIEDINRDNSFNETESYFSYELPIENDGTDHLSTSGVLNPYVTDEVQIFDTIRKPGEPDRIAERTWYRIKIPIESKILRHTVGSINDFRSIQFVRLIAKDFDQRVTFRFASFELGRNQWRRYTKYIGCYDGLVPTGTLDVNAVNIEENSSRQPFNYVLPPGVLRENSVGAFPDALQNEQALSLSVCDLAECDGRAIYKLLNLDVRQFERLKMFVHAETVPNKNDWKAGEARMFIRVGSDFTRNYYEYSIPLTPSDPTFMTQNRNDYAQNVWKNQFDFPLEALTNLKKDRNLNKIDLSKPYTLPNPERPEDFITIVGNPNLGLVKGVMVGYLNKSGEAGCAEVWINELRLTGINESRGYAGLARADFKMADFMDLQLSTLYESVRWGSIDQKTAARSLDEHIQMDAAASVSLDKFFGEKSGLKLPFYLNYSRNVRNPLYDPNDLDLKLKEKISLEPDRAKKREMRQNAQDAVILKGFNFTNVRYDPKNKKKIPMPWAISNFSLTYAQNETFKRNPFVKSDLLEQKKGGLDYSYAPGLKPIQPFKKLIKKDKYLKFISEFNFNPVPTSLGFNTILERNKQATTYRFIDDTPEVPSTFYNKRFTWDRNYDLGWDLSKGLKFVYDANVRSIIDELNQGDPNVYTEAKNRALIKENFKKGGRVKTFTQNMTASYALPFKQIPMMDWVQSKASVSATYGWDAGSLKLPTFGNVIQNSQTRQINGDFNFETLYNKSKYLSKINKPALGKGGSKTKSGGSGAPGGKGDIVPGGRGGGREKSGATLDGGGDLGGGKGSKSKPFDPANPSEPPARDPSGKTSDGRMNLPGGMNPAGNAGAETDESADEKAGKGSKKGSKAEKIKAEKKKDRQPSQFERIAIRPLMTIRKARLNYTEVRSSVVPGFMPITKLFGQADGFNAPGWDFIIGNQPDQGWLNRSASLGRMSKDIMISQQVMRNFSRNFDGSATLEPFTDFRIELTANKQFQRNNTELFKIPDNFSNDVFAHRASRDLGSMTVSFFNLKTLFNKDINGLFNDFENTRPVVSTRLGIAAGQTDQHSIDQGYNKGYGKIHQEVLIPAFIAAYTKKDANTIGLDVFKTVPKLNWKVSYNGLSKLPAFKNIFASFNLTHGYKSTMTINSYATDLQYEANNRFALQTLTGSYVARYEIPQLAISEQLAPLLGIDMRFKNDMNFKVDMKKSRQLGMSFIDYRLAEQKTTDYAVTWGYKVKNVYIAFLYGKNGQKKVKKAKSLAKKKSKTGDPAAPIDPKTAGGGKPTTGIKGSDLKFDFTFSFRDDITITHQLDKDQRAEATRGSRTIRLNPTVDYQLNKQLNLGLFCDYNKTVPKTSASYPITNLQSGLRIRFTLQ